VGLQFVLKNSEPPDPSKGSQVDAASKKELEKFLKQLRKSKG
jgi:hypothetical protein